jgi:hypothetical protein
MKPSVTELIEMLDKPALMKWANKIGLDGIRLDDYKSKAKSQGISLHETVENFLKYGLLSDDENINEKIKKFFSDKEVIGIEQPIENEHFKGRYDIKLKWQGLIFIADFKSNSGVYFETKLQLAAYNMIENECIPSVIHLPEFLIRPITVDNTLYGEFIIHLSKLWTLKKQIESK